MAAGRDDAAWRALQLAISGVGALLFAALAACDTQQLKEMSL